MQALPRETVLGRNRSLIAYCQDIADRRWERFIGNSSRVLVEEKQDGMFTGYGEAYQPVAIQTGNDLPLHEIIEVNIHGYEKGRLIGKPTA